MASSVLEQTRSLHEDIEVLERAMYRELAQAQLQGKQRRADEVARDQVVAAMLDAHASRSRQLSKLYEDEDGARKEELAAMQGSENFTTFYAQVRRPVFLFSFSGVSPSLRPRAGARVGRRAGRLGRARRRAGARAAGR